MWKEIWLWGGRGGEELDGEFSENICDGGEGKSEEGKDVEAEDREDAKHGECGGQSRCLAFL